MSSWLITAFQTTYVAYISLREIMILYLLGENYNKAQREDDMLQTWMGNYDSVVGNLCQGTGTRNSVPLLPSKDATNWTREQLCLPDQPGLVAASFASLNSTQRGNGYWVT